MDTLFLVNFEVCSSSAFFGTESIEGSTFASELAAAAAAFLFGGIGISLFYFFTADSTAIIFVVRASFKRVRSKKKINTN